VVLEFSQRDVDVFVPDGRAEDEALARVSLLGIGAHPDDLEIMAYHGIRAGQGQGGPRFAGVVCTDGSGAPRFDADEDPEAHALRRTRREEQRAAARRGRYAALIQLDHPSEAVREDVTAELVDDLAILLDATRPRVVYTHSPADQHATHVGVCVAAIEAVRRLPEAARPEQVLGCEVWGGLDWLAEPSAVLLDLGVDTASWSALMQVFVSQTKTRPYHEGALGRSRANAVFREADQPGGDERLWRAMDLTPLVVEGAPDLEEFVRDRLAEFEGSVIARIAAARGPLRR
jgi:LmbE family N-acetylglucosaminyl deacetylase